MEQLKTTINSLHIRKSFDNPFPGRNFLEIRRYFSGIVAQTPLTLLTLLFQQETPLTPLAFRLNAVNAAIPVKNALTKNLIFLTS